MPIVNYVKKNEIVLIGDSLFPDKTAKVYFDDISVDQYCQSGNKLFVTNAESASKFRTGVGIIDLSSGTFARVLASANNLIYLDQNYLTISIDQYGATALETDQYKFDDLICQVNTVKITTKEDRSKQVSTGPISGSITVQTEPPIASTGLLWTRDSYYGPDNCFLNTYGVWKYTNKGTTTGTPPLTTAPYYLKTVAYFTETYKVSFPTTGWYQFTYQVDDEIEIKLDGTVIVPYVRPGVTVGGLSYYYKWITAGVHEVAYYAHNTWTSIASVALVINGPGTEAYNGGALPVTHTNFSRGYFNNSTGAWTSGTTYHRFATRNEPDSFYEYSVNVTFAGRVQYYDKVNKLLTVRPEFGNFNVDANKENSTIRKITPSGIATTQKANVASIISGNIFQTGYNIVEINNTSYYPGDFTLATSNTAEILSYTHKSGGSVGLIPTVTGNTTDQYFILQSNVPSTVAGKTFKYSDSTGLWVTTTVSSVYANNKLVLTNGGVGAVSNTKYSFDSTMYADEYGIVCGMLNLPDGISTTGSHNIRIVDDLDTTVQSMAASATYTTVGSAASSIVHSDKVLKTSTTLNNSISQYRKIWQRRGFDPVAQVFYVPGEFGVLTGETSSPYGLWVSSVDLFFSQKAESESLLPVIVRIVEVENNLPTNRVIAEATLSWDKVKAPATGSTTLASYTPYSDSLGTIDEAKVTKFKFDDPVYLEPDTKYAITVSSDSPYYKVFIADTSKNGGYLLGTTTTQNGVTTGRKISKEPYAELFYTSQNASLWTPYVGRDLMFRVNKCVFNTSQYGYVKLNPQNAIANVYMDSVVLRSSEFTQAASNTQYTITANTVYGISGDDNQIKLEPQTLFSFGDDLVISSAISNRRRVFIAGNKQSLNVEIALYTNNSDVTPIVDRESLAIDTIANYINDGSISNTDIAVITGGRHSNSSNVIVTFSAPDDSSGTKAVGYAKLKGSISNTDIIINSNGSHVNAANIIVTFSAPPNGQTANAYVTALPPAPSNIIVDIPGSGYENVVPTITFTEAAASSNASGVIRSNISSIAVTSGGSGYYTTPTVTIEEPSMTANATAVVSGETSSIGGNCLVRYITKRVDLAEGFNAGDLRVYLDCIRPKGTNILVYYKVKSASDSDTFDSKNWKLMNKVENKYSPDQKTTVEIEYLPTLVNNALQYTENSIDYPIGGTFNQFAIKIVMTAADPTVIPRVTNLAAIAIPAG